PVHVEHVTDAPRGTSSSVVTHDAVRRVAEARIDRRLAEARATLPPRPGPEQLDGLVAAGALVVDIRPIAQRDADGELPGAVVIDRNVLEWRLDPTSAHRIPEAGRGHRSVVVVCNEGYASSLAAAELQRLGIVG